MDLLLHALLGQSACMYVWEARLSSLIVISIPVSLWNPRYGCAAVGLVAGQGDPVCMHPSRSLGAVPGPRRIHGFLT